MDRVNPLYIPRNHLVEEALTAATAGDLEPFAAPGRRPRAARSSERPGLEAYAAAGAAELRRRTGRSAAPDREAMNLTRPRA